MHSIPPGASGWVTLVAHLAVVRIPGDAAVFIVHVGLIVLMAINAAEYSIVRRVGMAVGTQIPYPGMFPGIDGEILPVVIKGRRYPGSLGMA